MTDTQSNQLAALYNRLSINKLSNSIAGTIYFIAINTSDGGAPTMVFPVDGYSSLFIRSTASYSDRGLNFYNYTNNTKGSLIGSILGNNTTGTTIDISNYTALYIAYTISTSAVQGAYYSYTLTV